MLTATFDEKLGILRSVSAGYTTDDEVETYIRASQPLIKLARARRGHLLHLVQASETPVQSQAAMARLTTASADTYQPGDRTAVVLQSALATMQSKRTSAEDRMGRFAAEEEALAWLLGDEYRDLVA